MIRSDLSAITPERELAYLALNPPRDEVEGHRRSMSLGAVDAPTGLIGPALPPHMLPITIEEEEEVVPFSMDIDDPPIKSSLVVINGEDKHVDDNKSEDTLIGDDIPPAYNDNSDYVLLDGDDKKNSRTDDKENRLPKRTKVDLDTINDPIGERDTDPLIPKTQEDEPQQLPTPEGENLIEPFPPPLPQPDRPPPIPPRPAARRDSDFDLISFGKQQDVTECIENVMFQIEAALKPESLEADGEQVDIIKR